MGNSYTDMTLFVRTLIKKFPSPTLVCRCDDSFEIIASNELLWHMTDCESEEEFMQFSQGTYSGLAAFGEQNISDKDILRAKMDNTAGVYQNYFRMRTNKGAVLDVSDKKYPIELPGGEDFAMYMFELNGEADMAVSESCDSLTGFYTQRQFLQCADEVLQGAYQDGTYGEYAVIYGNICNFKMFNIKYGTEAGDRVLKAWSQNLATYSQDNIHARFLGDHFVTLSHRKNLQQEVQDICTDFNKKYSHYGISIKVGICPIKKDMSVSRACDLAKIASDAIREDGESVRICDEKFERKMNLETYIMENLDNAIENGYIKVFYQPVMRTVNNSLCGMEALARWIDPQYGFLSPGEFIPVLEEHQMITKLDLHILYLVCQEMKAAQQAGKRNIPISFNLSRLDFTSCNIFEEVEKIVLSSGIARDMINIEITESTIMREPEFMRNQIDRFRNGGYQVWMDDFGSGYSSLNVLKEYDFDEIKLDMAFLSTFDKKSQSIIKSIIKMAKSLGIQTLAEGVETQEQYEFLRDIGCEKAQGYYFSKPMPGKELFDMLWERNTIIESREWRNYYDMVGAVDMLNDKSKVLLEYDGEKFNCAYLNSMSRYVWRSLGARSTEAISELINSPSSALNGQFRDIQMVLEVEDGFYETFCSVNEHDVMFLVRCLAKQSNKSMYEVEIINLSNNVENKKRETLESVYHMMYALYDSIYLMNVEGNTLEPLKQSLFRSDAFIEELKQKVNPNVDMVKKYFINPADMSKYESFTDRRTLKQRLEKSEHGYIAQLFRTRMANGAYAWKTHTILNIPGTDKAVYSTRVSPLMQEDVVETIRLQYMLHDEKSSDKETKYNSMLHHALLESDTINLFWKDKQRRYLGANQKFMQTFGFKSQDEFVGKTDEEMGWYLDNTMFRNDELEVLNKGSVLEHKIGTCIIQGMAEKILSSKEPLYENGKIIGLLGSFVKVGDLEKNFGYAGNINLIDAATGVKSMQGMVSILTDYLDGFNLSGEKFAVIKVYHDEYERDIDTYGLSTARKMLKDFAQILTGEAGYRGSCARIYGGEFAIAMKYTNRKAIEGMMTRLERRIGTVRALAGYRTTITPSLRVFYADDLQDPRDIFACVVSGHIGTLMKEHQKEIMPVAGAEN